MDTSSGPVDGGRAPIADPLSYPGRVVGASSVLAGDRLTLANAGALDEALAAHGGAPLAARTPCVAVGSNACPAQLAAKFAAASPAGRVLPIVPTMVRGLRQGFGALVSRPGYLPYAPVAEAGAETRLHLLWLDREQLELLDSSEPNYRALSWPCADGAADVAVLYRSRFGVLCSPGSDSPLRATDQRSLFALLTGEEWFRELLGADASTPEAAVAALAAAEGLRVAVREGMARNGLVCDDGLGAV